MIGGLYNAYYTFIELWRDDKVGLLTRRAGTMVGDLCAVPSVSAIGGDNMHRDKETFASPLPREVGEGDQPPSLRRK